MRPRRCVLVFAKLPRAGRVKTRLFADLSPSRAAELAAAFLDDLAQRLAEQPFDSWFAWALEPGDPEPAPPAPLALPAIVQRGADLGERMAMAFADTFATYDQVVIVGADVPDLTPATCLEAFTALDRGAEIVLGPATDGGFYLIAAAAPPPPELFAGIVWGGEEVLAATRRRCVERGLAVAMLAPASDVDTPADLARLAARLAAAPELCPRTHALLAAWGRLPRPPQSASMAVATP